MNKCLHRIGCQRLSDSSQLSHVIEAHLTCLEKVSSLSKITPRQVTSVTIGSDTVPRLTAEQCILVSGLMYYVATLDVM